MICPSCKSNIPDDFKFCPDCGTPVVNIEELRAKAKEITIQYKKGYDFYVNDGVLPRFVYNLTAANREKIVAMETEIINKHLLIENEELKKAEEQRKIKEANRLTEEQLIRDVASSITIQYAKAYNYYVNIGALPRFVHNLDIAKCNQIIAKKNDIIGKHYEILKQERADDEKKKREEEFHEKYVEYIHQKRAEPINNESKTGVFYFIVGAFVTCSTGPFVMWLSGSQEPLSIILYSLIIDVLVGLIWSFVLGGKSKD